MSRYYECTRLGVMPLSVRDSWGEDRKCDAISEWRRKVKRVMEDQGLPSVIITIDEDGDPHNERVYLKE